MVQSQSCCAPVKIQISIGGRVVATHWEVDPLLSIEEAKRRALREALQARQLRISEAFHARIEVSDERAPTPVPTSFARQLGAVPPNFGRGGFEG
jgi:hypothetical protein